MKTTPFTYHYFLSYSSADYSVVRDLYERLLNRGLDVWLDQEEIQAGESIPKGIERGLAASRSMIVVLSKRSVESGWTELERNVQIFEDPTGEQRKIVPVLLEDCDLPLILRHRKYLDARNGISATLLAALVKATE